MKTVEKTVSTGKEKTPEYQEWKLDVQQLELGKDISVSILNPQVPFKVEDIEALINSKWSFDQMNTSRRLKGTPAKTVKVDSVLANLMSPPISFTFAKAFEAVYRRAATLADATSAGIDVTDAAALAASGIVVPTPTPAS
jgi:hypothetical protein